VRSAESAELLPDELAFYYSVYDFLFKPFDSRSQSWQLRLALRADNASFHNRGRWVGRATCSCS
jgi:hypothetical protein